MSAADFKFPEDLGPNEHRAAPEGLPCRHQRIKRIHANVAQNKDGHWVSRLECECGVLLTHLTQERATFAIQTGGPYSPDYVEVK